MLLLWLPGRVGKTSILLRYVENTYDAACPSTLQASYLEKRVIIEDGTNNYSSSDGNAAASRREAQLSIWDTAGQERFHSLGPIYYRDAKGAILVYDVTDRPSFERVRKWTKELRKMVGDGDKICISIVGNKIDLQDRAVDTEEAKKYALSVGAAFLEVSAKTGR
jgi:Ras-related protein Rab-21